MAHHAAMDDAPRRGGTLTLVGAGDVDHLDPALAYHTVTRNVLRAVTRQLVGYVASRDRGEAGVIVADLATEVPTRSNGRVSPDGTCYTFTLRDDVRWGGPDGGRPVTAWDVVRGIKRLAHPLAPSPGLAYYLEAVAGLVEFRDALARGPQDDASLADRLERTPLPGVQALNETDVRFVTAHATSDFLNLLALPFATPAPFEYLAHRPGSDGLNRVLRSNGPYTVAAYAPGRRIELERNPEWIPKTDDLRAGHVDRIVVREGLEEAEAHRLVATGEADMLWDVQPLTAELPGLLRGGDPRLEVYPAGLLSPYLVINFAGRDAADAADAADALGERAVRLALQYAVDKAAVSDVWGGPLLNEFADQLLPPLCSARVPRAFYPTPGGRGDPRRARDLLARAGYPDGVRVRLVHRDRDIHPETARVVAAGLERAGFRVELLPVSINALFDEYFAARSGSPARWDLALTGWEPDWYGNNARSYLLPLVDSRRAVDGGDWGSNVGHYRSDEVNALLTQACTCADEDRAGELFRRVEAVVMRDAALVPLLFAHQYWMHAERVRNWLPYPVLNGDLTNLWLRGPGRTAPDEPSDDRPEAYR